MAGSENSIEKLIAGGLLGAAIGAMLSKEDKEEGAFIGALLGAAVAATLAAHKKARETGQPVLVAENGKLYQIMPDGRKVFVKELPQAPELRHTHFTLK